MKLTMHSASLLLLFAQLSAAGTLPREFCDNVNKETGFVQIGEEDKHYFYWYFESRSKPSTDPLLLWLNGGPGCASELGLFTENGPCSVNPDGNSTKINPFSWNTNANVLYVDQPTGTGFSYGSEFDKDEDTVGDDFWHFLQGFFESHPNLAQRDFYISGESYAGHYIPAIAHRIINGNQNIQSRLGSLSSAEKQVNLKGIAIGNGLTNAEVQYAYYPDMAFSTNHHVAAVSEWEYRLMKLAVPPCVALIKACNANLPGSCIAAEEACNLSLMGPYQASGKNVYDMRKECETPPLCSDYSFLDKFLNRADIQKMLGVGSHGKKFDWEECNQQVNILFALNGDGIKNMAPKVTDILEAGVEVLIYAGDQDYICNWIGNHAWVEQLEWSGKDGYNAAEQTQWFVGPSKVAGMTKTFKNLRFLRVFDAGHMVPTDQPAAALKMLQKFVLKKTVTEMKRSNEFLFMSVFES